LYFLIDRFAARFGVEYRHPLTDRRVMEFCLALPPEQLRRGGEEKAVLRRAMKGLLPETVRTRQTKALYGTHAYADALEDLGGESFFASMEIAARGWVDGIRVCRMYRQMASARDVAASRKNLYPLWMIASIELWYRTVVEGSAHARPSAEVCASSEV
jgi:asparagine synthase (glutamine-hydrolysing)